MLCAGLCASVIYQGFELDRVKRELAGSVGVGPARVRLLLEEAQHGGKTERAQANLELVSLLQVRASMLKRLPKVLGRAALFIGASTGFIELASGLPSGAPPWLGVACLGTGLVAQGLVVGLGGRIQKRAEALVSRAKAQI